MRTLLYPVAFLTVLSAGLLAFGWIVTNGLQPPEPPRTILFASPMLGPDRELLEAPSMDRGVDETAEDSGTC